MKLTTILYNVRKRGFVVHVKNSIIMNDKLKFLRIHIDKSGIKPYVKEWTSNWLKQRQHRTAKNLKWTIRTLN